MKRRLTLIAGALALVVAIGAAIGFVRRRVERLDSHEVPGTNGSVGSSNGSIASTRHKADVDADPGR